MKRIAAVAAVVLAMLAVPATAMASTAWGGPQPPPRHHPGPYPGPRPGPPGICRPWDGGGTGFFCCNDNPVWGGWSQDCQQQAVTFRMGAYSSTATELQGPRLSAGEVVIYQHQFYTVGSVWYRHFTLDQDGSLFTNGSYPIWDGSATVLTGGWSFQNTQ